MYRVLTRIFEREFSVRTWHFCLQKSHAREERERGMRDRWGERERERRKRQNESKMKKIEGGLWDFFLWVCILVIFVPPLDIISFQFFPHFHLLITLLFLQKQNVLCTNRQNI